MPAAMIAATQFPAVSLLGKPISTARQDADGHLGHHAQKALGSDHYAEQIVSLGIEVLAAEPDDLAVDGDEFDPEHVIGGETIFEAMHAAGVLGNIAADRAGDLARGIRRVIEPRMLNGERHAEVCDAGLRHHAAVMEIDLQYPIEFGHAENDAVGQRQGATGERRARAARHHLDLVVTAVAQHAGHLLGRRGQYHQQPQGSIGGETVALVGTAPVLFRNDAFARHDLAERPRNLGAARDHSSIGLGHSHQGSLPAYLGPGRPRANNKKTALEGTVSWPTRRCVSPGEPCSGGSSC